MFCLEIQEVNSDSLKEIYDELSECDSFNIDEEHDEGKLLFLSPRYDYAESIHYDLCEVSKKFPTVVFELTEDDHELGNEKCRHYFKNGLIQNCDVTITFDSYDPSKLTEFKG